MNTTEDKVLLVAIAVALAVGASYYIESTRAVYSIEQIGGQGTMLLNKKTGETWSLKIRKTPPPLSQQDLNDEIRVQSIRQKFVAQVPISKEDADWAKAQMEKKRKASDSLPAGQYWVKISKEEELISKLAQPETSGDEYEEPGN